MNTTIAFRSMCPGAFALAISVAAGADSIASITKPDPWQPLRRLIGRS
jgi:hypothetical protein